MKKQQQERSARYRFGEMSESSQFPVDWRSHWFFDRHVRIRKTP